jgi:hypothetical protein
MWVHAYSGRTLLLITLYITTGQLSLYWIIIIIIIIIIDVMVIVILMI